MANEKHTREQIIAEGLKRGELLATEKCGCMIIQDRTADAYIVYCPLHKVALELLEAIKKLVERDDYGSIRLPTQAKDILLKAIAKAEKGGSK